MAGAIFGEVSLPFPPPPFPSDQQNSGGLFAGICVAAFHGILSNRRKSIQQGRLVGVGWLVSEVESEFFDLKVWGYFSLDVIKENIGKN